MKIHYLLTALSLSLVATAQTLPGMPYHPSPKRPVVDPYFGKAVTDNYRWLEGMNSPETRDWFKAQGDYSNRVLAQIPGRDAPSASGKPVLMQVNYDNGHFTEDKAVTFRNFATVYAFALWQAGYPDFQRSVAETKI